MNHSNSPASKSVRGAPDTCRVAASAGRKGKASARLLPLWVVCCAGLPACAQSPWSPNPSPQNQLAQRSRAAEPPRNAPPQTVSPSQLAELSAAPGSMLVRGQEPVEGTLISSASSALSSPAGERVREFDAGDLIAVVGTEYVLAGDMMVFIEPILEQQRSKITPAQEKQLKANLIRQVLSQYVEIKALYQEFFRDMVGNKPPKEVAEMQQQITTKAGQIFYEKQIPNMLKKYEVNDIAALEVKLREKSISISSLRTQFTERVLSAELERKYVPDEYEFSRAELYTYYQEHEEDWKVAGRAKWRELCVRFSKHAREEAEALIQEMGNQVYLGGKPFEAVAKQQSEGFTASEGGLHDWTTQGSLKSQILDQSVFSLPLRRLSKVIEDEAGFHIIEVLEREPGHKKLFDAAQPEIRKKLSEEKRSKLLDEFHTKVMARTSIWTLWPEDIPDSRALSEALGDAHLPPKP